VTPGLTRRCARSIGGALLSALIATPACAQGVAANAGESIYRHGVLPSGQPLTAKREPDLDISGADAACTNCHRHSGLGEKEGRINIPPITGPYLFHPRAKDQDDFDLPFVETMRPDRDPFTADTLARAIRDGIGPDGHELSYLMPHYALNDADMAALIAYLRGMMPAKVPGVSESVLHFATIITPDADPVKRQGMLDVLNQFFADKDTFSRAQAPRLRSSHRMMFKSPRRWQLHVWELTGMPDTWDKQLHEHLKREPVFAVISGLGAKTWAPVHEFCEEAALPCLFPNVDLPVVAEHDFYSLYFSRGVLLEADLIARRLIDNEKSPAPRRIVQVFHNEDIGRQAAKAVRASAAAAGLQIIDRPLGAGSAKPQLNAALRDVAAHDALVLWLRPPDLAALGSLPAGNPEVFISGLMGGLDQSPLPAAWRGVTKMVYPFDLPDKRRIRVDYPLGWFRVRHIPVVAEQVQTDTWLACGLLSETLNHMADSFIRDYLVERIEGMLEHRIVTGYYPRLALAPNQRFASKGGYIVHFADSSGSRLLADGDWLVP
jgi:hypothetical protein